MKTVYVLTQHKVSGAGHESNVIYCTDSLCEAKKLDVKEGYYNTIDPIHFKKSHSILELISTKILKSIMITSLISIVIAIAAVKWIEGSYVFIQIMLTGLVYLLSCALIHNLIVQEIKRKDSDI